MCLTRNYDKTPFDSPLKYTKTQFPGYTAKMNVRHYVKHDYHDHAQDMPAIHDSGKLLKGIVAKQKPSKANPFPFKLHELLGRIQADGLGHIVSWQPHGRAFLIHKPKDFVSIVMPRYFRQTKITSFQRQLNLYGFSRITRGPDAGAYYHELFLRGMEWLSNKMVRIKVKGTGFKAAGSPETEPDFYTMAPLVISTTKEGGDAAMVLSSNNIVSGPQEIHSNKTGDQSVQHLHRRKISIDDKYVTTPAVSSSTATAEVNAWMKSISACNSSTVDDEDVNLPIREYHTGDLLHSFNGLPFHYIDPKGLHIPKPAPIPFVSSSAITDDEDESDDEIAIEKINVLPGHIVRAIDPLNNLPTHFTQPYVEVSTIPSCTVYQV